MKKYILRNKMLGNVKDYYGRFHKKAEFIPGKTKIPYAGRVYDHTEMMAIVDAALDFWLTAGPMSSMLETKLKKYFGSKDFLLVNSGSSANLLMASAMCAKSVSGRLKPGDEVITPAVTFPTTVGPLIQYGLVPVFVDAKVGTYNINESLIEGALSRKTKAVFIPHTLGNPCDMDIISRAAARKGLIVIEDNCDALGSRYGGKLTGSFGAMSSASFYPAHHMTLGEGGGVAVNDERFIKAANSIRDWGRDCYCPTGRSDSCNKRFAMKMGGLPFGYDHKYIYSNIGYNLKLTEMQSAVGLVQFERLSRFEKARRANFNALYEGLREYSEFLIMPESCQKAEPSWFAFPITVKRKVDRLKLVKWLENSKIETRLMFGGNIVRQPAFKGIKCRIPFGLAETDRIMNNTFFIGVYPGITSEMTDYMISRFQAFFKNRANYGR